MLLDGVERLGVLEVVPLDGADVDDPVLREQCHWLATLLGHLVTVTTQYGDGLDVQRRRRHRGSPAELLWHSLPPLTGATERVVVGASVQPAYDLRGTVFDYALSERRAQLAMFDGDASSAVVNALSAYRAARRDGASLPDQYAAVGAELAGRHGRHRSGGRAGPAHRRAAVAGRRAPGAGGRPRGLGAAPGRTRPRGSSRRTPGRAPRRSGSSPGTWSRCTPPGSSRPPTKAGSRSGTRGSPSTSNGVPEALPPEIARLVTRAVIGHSGGELRHDAGILVARWQPR